MILAYLLLITGLTISAVAIYYSVVGLTAIFSAAAIPIMIMGVSLEIAKLVCATWIKQYWTRVPMLMKTYMVTAVIVLMLITSMGIFGFLSKAHNDQNLVSGDVQSKIAIYDEKIVTARSNIEADRKQLTQMDAAVDQVMGRSSDSKGADKAVAIRNNQKRDRAAIAKDIETNQKSIAKLNDEAAPIRAEVRKVDAEVGPIKYIAAFIYGTTPDSSMLEKAVTWIIISIVVVFDPLAVIMLLASQMTFEWKRKDISDRPKPEPEENILDDEDKKVAAWFDHARERARFWDKQKDDTPSDSEYKPDDPTIIAEPSIIEEEPIPEIKIVDEVIEKIIPVEVEPVIENIRAPEAVAGRNRGVMYSPPIQADNEPSLGKASNSDFGNQYPTNPEKGDVYLRTDYLPNRLFKYNGFKWIEVDKSQTDVYAYEERYIKYLIEQLDQGTYDADTLTDTERQQIAKHLGKNA